MATFNPRRHRDRAHPPVFSDEVHDAPTVIALLDVLQRQRGHLGPRQEIESLRSIRSLVGEYVSQPRPKRPLSIAVFGPPGSGKSFGITQLALALRPGEIEPKEFNLSQLGSTDELLSALHQVRDIGLGGKIPLVFWDEFPGFGATIAAALPRLLIGTTTAASPQAQAVGGGMRERRAPAAPGQAMPRVQIRKPAKTLLR
jgi:hypothetical protein